MQLTSHFEFAYGYPAVIYTLTWEDRELMPDGVHLTDNDNLAVTRSINRHLDTHRNVVPDNRGRALQMHTEYLRMQQEFQGDDISEAQRELLET